MTANDPSTIVVVGAGLAGASAAAELRRLGYSGTLTLIGNEPRPPYERPPLSKGILLGDTTPASTLVHPASWYAEEEVHLLTGAPVTALDVDRHEVVVDETALPYDRLLIATGTQPRRFPLADASGADVFYLRTLPDAERLQGRLPQRLLIIGGGWIGLEVAAAARTAGGKVTVIEAGKGPLLKILGPEVSQVFADLHHAHGVDLRTNTTVTAIRHGDGQTTVRLSDGGEIEVDAIVVAIGAEPNTSLARDAGLNVDNGILVDAQLRASAPGVYAAGDIANHEHPDLGRIRVEHWDNAIGQGRHAARAMLGDPAPYTSQPYFYTDQYDLGMEFVGHVGPAAHEIRASGDLQRRVFTVWWIRDNTVIAGMHVGDWDAIDQIRELVGGPAEELPH